MAKVNEINVSYSVGLKANLGNYESADFHLSESHRIDVSDLKDEEVSALADSVRAEISVRLNDELVDRAVKLKAGSSNV